jgi:hypothetical protein
MSHFDLKSLESIIQVQAQTRERFRQLLENASDEERCRIHSGMSNHMLWNYGHTLVTFYLLTYGRCELEIPLLEEVLESYRKGSKPEPNKAAFSYESLKEIDLSTAPQLIQDFKDGKLKNYQAYQTSYGIHLSNIEEALRFNLIHEALHLGYAMAQFRMTQQD